MTIQQLIDQAALAVVLARGLPTDSAQVAKTLALMTDVLAVVQGAGVQGLIHWETVELDEVGAALAENIQRQLVELGA